MKIANICALLLVGAAYARPNFDEIDSSGFGQFTAKWEAFKKRTGILPLNPAQEAVMEANWEKAQRQVDAWNADPSHREKEQTYDFDVMSDEEFERTKTGLIFDPSMNREGGLLPPTKEMLEDRSNVAALQQILAGLQGVNVPATHNPIGTDAITPIKGQGSCRSCSAFAAMAQVEMCFLKKGVPGLTSQSLDLSEQQVMDCAYNGKTALGCQGATLDVYQNYYKNNKGTYLHENNYGYSEERSDTCPRNRGHWETGAYVSKVAIGSGAQCGVDAIKAGIIKHGSVAAGILCNSPEFRDFRQDMITQCTGGSNIDHAVLIVGWDKAADGTDYWIIKNSWNTHWGLNGFGKVKFGAPGCMLENYCTFIECESNGKASDPAPPALPNDKARPCDVNYWWSNLNGERKIDLGAGIVHMKCAHGKCTTCFTGSTKVCPENYNTCKDYCFWVKDLDDSIQNVKDCPKMT